MVKDELGSDAVILHTKKYKQGGFLGYNSKEIVEVTAAVDDTPRRPRVKLPAISQARRKNPSPPRTPMNTSSAVSPRSVLAQYKTAGTEEAVNRAKSAEIASRKEEPRAAAPAFIPMAPESVARESLTPVEEAFVPNEVVQKNPAPRIVAVTPSNVSTQKRIVTPVAEARPIIREKIAEETAKKIIVPPKIISSSAKRNRKSPTVKTKTETAPKTDSGRLGQEQVEDASKSNVRPENVKSAANEPEKNNPIKESKPQEKIRALEDELAQMRQMLRQVMNQSGSSDAIVKLRDILKAHELREDVMQDIIRKIPPATLMLGKDDPEATKGLSEYLHNVLKTGDGIGLKDGRPKIVALIGTTGVGKTTTIAKIAAKFVLERGISVALITADTYRISAVDQLKTYSDIIGLPLEIVYSPSELGPALKRHKNKKLILIDTAGRSQNNEYQMQELKEFLAADPSIEKHLVMSATTKERDAEAILDRFADCHPDRILVTKTDETESIGAIVNLLFDRRIALSYITTGQSVPDDIEPAKPEALARLLLR